MSFEFDPDYSNTANSLRYQRRKRAGMCTWEGCKRPPGETLLCEHHREFVNTNRRGAGKYAAKRLESMRRYQAAKVARGECRSCSAPLVTQTQCERHARVARARYYERKLEKLLAAHRAEVGDEG